MAEAEFDIVPHHTGKFSTGKFISSSKMEISNPGGFELETDSQLPTKIVPNLVQALQHDGRVVLTGIVKARKENLDSFLQKKRNMKSFSARNDLPTQNEKLLPPQSILYNPVKLIS